MSRQPGYDAAGTSTASAKIFSVKTPVSDAL